MSTWEERMGAKGRERRKREEERHWTEDMADYFRRHPNAASPTPPDDGTCRECYEWRPYPPEQKHFGYAWWQVCDWQTCGHQHHEDEIWLAS